MEGLHWEEVTDCSKGFLQCMLKASASPRLPLHVCDVSASFRVKIFTSDEASAVLSS